MYQSKIKTVIFSCYILCANLAHALSCPTSISSYIQHMAKKQHITGMAVAIVTPHSVQFCNYGYAHKHQRQKITEKSMFEIASLTKTFTGLLAAQAVTEGKLNLKAPITQYIPELAVNAQFDKVNSQQLLTHMSGLPLRLSPDFTESQLLTAAAKLQFNYPPGSRYQYSNAGISLSALALTRIYGVSYAQLLNQFILQPLNMRYTALEVKPEYRHLLVTGYNRRNKAVLLRQLGTENAAAGLKSNTYDLAKYLQLQLGTKPYRFARALRVVHKNYVCLYNDGTYQQLAWEYHPHSDWLPNFKPEESKQYIPKLVRDIETGCPIVSGGFIDKTGNSSGMTSYMVYAPEKKIGVVVLTNNAAKSGIVDLARHIIISAR